MAGIAAFFDSYLGGASTDSDRPTRAPDSRARHNARLRANLNLPPAQSPIADDATSTPRSTTQPCRLDDGPDDSKPPLPRATGPLEWDKSALRVGEMAELFASIHSKMGHVKYAISGLAAMIDHGYSARAAGSVSIICPSESKDVIKGWAFVSGCRLVKESADSILMTMHDGRLRRVRVKYLDGGFEQLEFCRSVLCPEARLLGLSSQLEQIAQAYLALGGSPNPEQKETKVIVGDVFWVLRKVANERKKLEAQYLTAFLSERFWSPFTSRYEDARFECSQAGIDVSSVLRRHREDKEIGEHEELLRQYGVPRMTRDSLSPFQQQHGTFEAMRSPGSLGDRVSTYTSCSSANQLRPGSTVTRSTSTRPPATGRFADMRSMERRESVRSVSVEPARPSERRSRESAELVCGRGTPSNWI
jgi:hypothetical protein